MKAKSLATIANQISESLDTVTLWRRIADGWSGWGCRWKGNN